MSWRTTAVLFVILLILGGLVYYQSQQAPQPTPTPTTLPSEALIADVAIADVVRLDVRRVEDQAAASFSRQPNGAWFQTVPTNTQVISQTMVSQVTGLFSLTSRSALPAEANPLSAYGLEAPAYEIVLVTMRDGQNLRYTFLVGNETPTGEGFYIQRRGDPRVHVTLTTPIQNVINLLEDPPIPTPVPSPTAAVPITGTATLSPTLPLTGTVTPAP